MRRQAQRASEPDSRLGPQALSKTSPSTTTRNSISKSCKSSDLRRRCSVALSANASNGCARSLVSESSSASWPMDQSEVMSRQLARMREANALSRGGALGACALSVVRVISHCPRAADEARPDRDRLSGLVAVRALAPDRPELRAALLDAHAHYRRRIDTVDAARLLFRRMAFHSVAEDEQAFGLRAGNGELAMLEAFLARRRIGPRVRAADVRRPEQIAAAAATRLHRIGPQAEHHGAVRAAHAAPARARVVQINAARLEGRAARNEPPALHAVSRRRTAALGARGKYRVAEFDHLALTERERVGP